MISIHLFSILKFSLCGDCFVVLRFVLSFCSYYMLSSSIWQLSIMNVFLMLNLWDEFFAGRWETIYFS